MRNSDQAFDVMSIIGQRGLPLVLKEEHQGVPVLIRHSAIASNTSSGMHCSPLFSCSFRQRAGLAVYICVFLTAVLLPVMNGLDAWYTLVCNCAKLSVEFSASTLCFVKASHRCTSYATHNNAH